MTGGDDVRARDEDRTVLIVEDDQDIRDTMAAVLEAQGFEVDVAGNGADALEALRAGRRPDVILLDLMMPVMDGWQFRAEQQKDPALADIPVVLVSAFAPVSHHARELGATAYLQKPFDLDTMLGAVDRALASG
jgi:CheY-like chemotaxis protein